MASDDVRDMPSKPSSRSSGSQSPASPWRFRTVSSLMPGESPFGSEQKLGEWKPDAHAPFVCLINPRSGGKKGQAILEVCTRSQDVYQESCFDIVKVVRDTSGLRKRLNWAKDRAVEKNLPSFRPRIICGGGDGTASFALMCVFKALRNDAGEGFIWTDEEMEKYFPALVQMPLGTGNDLGGVLGWGRKYPGYVQGPFCSVASRQAARGRKLSQWFDLALRTSTPVVPFDIWGFMPPPGQDVTNVKMCELADVARGDDGRKVYMMKRADVVVPFLVLLYASYGFGANVVARFQLVRHDSQLANLLEYARISQSVLFGTQCPQVQRGLEGLRITNLGEEAEKNGSDQYFPPRKTRSAARYKEAGFMNINSMAGGALKGRDRAGLTTRWCMCDAGRQQVDYGDGKADFYRQSVVRTFAKTGTRLQVDKKRGATFRFEANRGKGIFMQYDGEGRFAFSPDGQPWRMDIQQVLRVPMVVHPSAHRPASSSSSSDPVKFEIIGDTPEEAARVKARIFRWIAGDLVQEMNATEDEINRANLPTISRPSGEVHELPQGQELPQGPEATPSTSNLNAAPAVAKAALKVRIEVEGEDDEEEPDSPQSWQMVKDEEGLVTLHEGIRRISL